MASITFRKGGRNSVPLEPYTAILGLDNWDDYSFKTLFTLALVDEDGKVHSLGSLKVGFKGQSESRTSDFLPDTFQQLDGHFFSLGQDSDYYKNLRLLSQQTRNSLLTALRDMIYFPDLLLKFEKERVFSISLTRSISKSVLSGQFQRVLSGGAVLTPFKFSYTSVRAPDIATYTLDFEVMPESKPSTNIHVLIGRNGVGKTSLLNNMISSVVNLDAVSENHGAFLCKTLNGENHRTSDYFGGVASVSFSAFDPFVPPPEQIDREKGLTNFYIGLKKIEAINGVRKALPKSGEDLERDFSKSFHACFSQVAKKERWLKAIVKLESDENFKNMDLGRLGDVDVDTALIGAGNSFKKMSSGHMVVLLTITKLVELVEEKTLVLMDEPESHLHPPLLSAFVRALSELLSDRNGVAIIATHSPVVVQEVPRSCVWKLYRIRSEGSSERPEEETFGENVGTLTREIFGLEVAKSGFHDVLNRAVQNGGGFEEIYQEYAGQLGFEAQAVLRALLASR